MVNSSSSPTTNDGSGISEANIFTTTPGDVYFLTTHQSNLADKQFNILINSPIDELSNSFGSAYEIEDKNAAGKFYAFVFNSLLPHRFKNLKILSDFKDDHTIITPKKVEILPIGEKDKYSLCAIMPRVNGISLESYIQRGTPITEEYLLEKILVPLLKSIMIYEDLGLTHGAINPKNIYLTDKEEVVIGDSIRELSGFSQEIVFEPLERMLHSPFAKADNQPLVDYFAFGVTVLYLLTGKKPLTGLTNNEIFEQRLRETTYYSYIRDAELSNNIKTFLKGMLSDRLIDRWGSRKILDWLNGKKYNVPVLGLYKEASRGYSISLKQHFNPASLVFELWNDWNNAKKTLKDPKLRKWLESSTTQEIAAMKIEYAVSMHGISFSSFAIDDDEFVARCLLAIDPDTGIKYNQICFSYEGIGSLLAIAFNNGRQDLFRVVNKLIEGGLTSLYVELKGASLRQESVNITVMLEKCRIFFSATAAGFGMERLLYEFNTNIPCQSPLVIDYYCTTITSLLYTLEKIHEKFDTNSVDRHLIAFIFSKLDSRKDLVLYNLSKYGDVRDVKTLSNLLILSTAQSFSPAKKLPKLTAKFVQNLSDTIDGMYKSATLKNTLKTKLAELAAEGNLELIIDIVTDNTSIAKDRAGYQMANKRFRVLEELINKNNNEKHIFNSGYSYGLRIGMVFSYIICAIVIFYSINQSIM